MKNQKGSQTVNVELLRYCDDFNIFCDDCAFLCDAFASLISESETIDEYSAGGLAHHTGGLKRKMFEFKDRIDQIRREGLG